MPAAPTPAFQQRFPSVLPFPLRSARQIRPDPQFLRHAFPMPGPDPLRLVFVADLHGQSFAYPLVYPGAPQIVKPGEPNLAGRQKQKYFKSSKPPFISFHQVWDLFLTARKPAHFGGPLQKCIFPEEFFSGAVLRDEAGLLNFFP